ncbi:DNA polymerase, partial [Candidatus Micrarchaeota archaeon]|nr:DNA polymerase [Candidatus Micrarchaeota archaeon]
SVEIVERMVGAEKKKLLKVFCSQPSDVPLLRAAIPFTAYEFRIPFAKRFMMDFGLVPFTRISYEREGKILKKIKSFTETEDYNLTTLAFDTEVYNPLGKPREKLDPVIMISYKSGKEGKVLTYKKINKKFVETLSDEKEIIEKFSGIVESEDPDIIYGYNSSNFDIPYLLERAKILRADFKLGRGEPWYKSIRRGIGSAIDIKGRVHLDLYPMMRFFGFIGIIKANQYTLEAVYREVAKTDKLMVNRLEIWKQWDSGELGELADYSLMDAEATYEIGSMALPLYIELSKVTRLPLFDTSIATSGQLVENLLMHESFKRNTIIPPRPSEARATQRAASPIKGAFVKLPEPGVYDNIAVLDFRGLYPSIIISYNIDPNTLTDSDKNAYKSPAGWKFKKSPKGLIPEVLDSILERRIEVKKKLKNAKKGTKEYDRLSARSQALKILANSYYGYLLYARSRWYSRKAGESVTAWGRQHINETIEKAEELGFEVLYGDTDSVFLLMKDKSKKDVMDFVEKINKKLPEKMELELESFYKRGVFVSKKSEEKGAKKKYALLADDGSIKIRGFELVRRDWSRIARETQRKVLEAILREGSREKAVKITTDVIQKLKSGNVPLEDLAIYTQISKDPKKYEIISPEISAARKAIKKGVPVEKGSIISYVVSKKGKSISEKAEPLDFAKDYDPDYYINNQVLPAVLKILKELGYSKDDLKHGGKQKGINDFF